MEEGKSDKIFRKEALQRMSSPEELDKLMQVTKPTGWLALITIGVIILIAALWGIFGRIPMKVTGSGILLNKGGILDVATFADGQVVEVYSRVGDKVKKGKVVALLAPLDASKNIKNVKPQPGKLQCISTSTTQVISPYAGTVIEITALKGKVVKTGDTIIRIESGEKEVEGDFSSSRGRTGGRH